MKKIIYLLLPLIGLSICSCTTYKSHYKAKFLVTSQHDGKGSIAFGHFEGQYVFNLKKTTSGEGNIKYTGSLSDGHVDVTYVDPIANQELPLFSISSGEVIDGDGGYIEKGYKVTIIVKADTEATDGSFTFNVN